MQNPPNIWVGGGGVGGDVGDGNYLFFILMGMSLTL